MNENKYRYWQDKHVDDGRELQIRTCNECKFSEVKVGDKESDWVAYLTLEKINFNHEYFKKHIRFPDCKSCKEWMEEINGW